MAGAAGGPIAVYGASGYTGKLVLRELVRRGLDHVAAGRSAAKLRAATEEAGSDAPVKAAAVDDRGALRHVLGDCAAVINCAGPFTFHGEPVVRAAVETGTHYVDTTGEQPYMQRIFERLDAPARAAEVAVVPAMGFDYVPGDLISHLAARGREPLRELVVAYSVSGFGASRGTLHSGLEMMKGGGIAYRDGAWVPAPGGAQRASFSFPEPIGRRPVMKTPSGEIVTVPRHVDTKSVVVLMDTRVVAPHPAVAPLIPFTTPALELALKTPVRALLDLAVDRLPEGPSEEDRRAASFTIVAVARGEDGAEGAGVLRGSDVYGLTAVTTVHAAELMTGAGFDRAGVLAPASAYDAQAFREYLGDHGVSYELSREAP
jgi:short subunit dehydrogenase-like uncharacterized protein